MDSCILAPMKILRVIIGVLLAEVGFAQTIPNLVPYPNASGSLETQYVTGVALDISGAFFQSIGTNGRSCATCHQAAQGFSISITGIEDAV